MAVPAPSRANSSRNALLGGFVLVLVGGAALASELWPDVDRYIPLVIGLGLLGVFAINRAYVALVGGAIMTGIGTGLLVADVFPGDNVDGPGAVLGLAFGFIGIWLVGSVMNLREHHFWPLIPGGILLLVGIGLVLDLFTDDISRLFVPAVVVVVGVLIMLLGYLRMSRGAGSTA
ncbi:MAG TPA: hypothetical protein VJK49_02515 [Candidatus Limnocylindrales bacterium]|nr:hypothetical protein [Candidatus Limnocylindrales bacterium]